MRRDKRRSVEDERWREGAADRKLWKERRERVVRQYFTLYIREQGGRADSILLTLINIIYKRNIVNK